jgi:DnaJ-class molecular chaperone
VVRDDFSDVNDPADPYVILGVSRSATQAEITHAYRTLLRAHHPDTRRTPSSHAADDELRKLLAAYALLREPARRADNDAAPPPSHAPTAAETRVAVSVPVHFRIADETATGGPMVPLRVGPLRWHR